MPQWLRHQDLILTIVLGAAGGILAPFAQVLYRNGGDLSTFVVPDIPAGNWLLFAALGSLMAYATVYLLANSERSDLKRLGAFALICGVGFPSALLSTLDQQAKTSLESLASARQIAESANVPQQQRIAASADAAVSTLQNTAADQIGREGKALVEQDTQELINVIAREDREKAMQVYSAARVAGFDNISSPAIFVDEPSMPEAVAT